MRSLSNIFKSGFLRFDGQFPPLRVWVAQLLHFAMIAGLVVLNFKPRVGALVTTLATVLFFSVIGMKSFPYIALVNVPPVAFAFLYTV